MSGPRPARRAVLLAAAGAGGGAAAVAAAAVVGGGPAGSDGDLAGPPPGQPGPAPTGAAVVPFDGDHQAGIATPAQAHGWFVALDLRPGVDRPAVRRLLTLLTDDARRLTSGRPPLGSDAVELAALPARLTVTFGFGAGLFDAAGLGDACPAVVRDLPVFPGDRLEERWSGGDLLLQLCADDPIPLSYALRRLVRDAREFATVRWTQRGFGPARGSEPDGTTPRNLLGQRDGSANPLPDGPDFAAAVWNRGEPAWLRGGSMLVLRRVRMSLDDWDDLGRPGKEQSVARRLADGAPVTGGGERDRPDLDAVDADGFPIVAAEAHAVRAAPKVPAERMFRRGYSYDAGPDREGNPDAGLLFAAYQADAATAFVPVQRRLAETDALHLWLTHVGSAAFAVPPGTTDGQFTGQGLIDG